MRYTPLTHLTTRHRPALLAKRNTLTTLTALATLTTLTATATLLSSGCKETGSGAGVRSPRPLHLYVAIDDSTGTRRHLGEYALIASQAAEMLRPGSDRLTVLRFDRTANEILDDPASGDAQATLDVIQRDLRNAPSQAGTFPQAVWEELAQRVTENGTGETAVLLLLSDGDNDVQTAAAQQGIAAVGKKLTASVQVRAVLLCGIEPGNRSYLRRCFGGLGAKRLSLLGPGELTAAHVLPLLSAAR